ncbi:hypothetical protein DICVIV_14021 [Dictyocaulus viviparus]|uniref:Secreted protein n=1 Tax=Dictyocaulus viviparus TaxID=29172 RepID=A0A0D8X8V1_DICVI|nr:hypothetical protein DICVIV_14021 [Dictyocaulus viviparus]
MYCPTALMAVMIAVAVSEAAQRCYTGSKDKYESRLCDTGVAGKYCYYVPAYIATCKAKPRTSCGTRTPHKNVNVALLCSALRSFGTDFKKSAFNLLPYS